MGKINSNIMKRLHFHNLNKHTDNNIRFNVFFVRKIFACVANKKVMVILATV